MSVTWAGQNVTIGVGTVGTPVGPAGGDLGGSFPNPTVDGLQGSPVSSTAPTTGYALVWSGTEWAPALVTASIPDGDKGDITVSASGATWTIDGQAVTYGKMQHCTADSLLGRASGNGQISEITCTAAGRALLDDADAAAQRTTLGISTAGGDLTGTYPNPTIASIGGATLAGQPLLRILRTDGAGGLQFQRQLHPRRQVVMMSEGGTAGDFVALQAGTAASVSFNAVSVNANRMGIAQASAGTTATGRAALASSVQTQLAFGYGPVRYETAVMMTILSTNVETFLVQAGFVDNLTAASVDSVEFQYTDTAGTGAAWDCVTRSNSVETRTTVGSNVVASQWYVLEIDINAAGTSVDFYIDGVLVATHTTNIPTGTTRATGAYVGIRKTAGLSARTVRIDYQYVEMEVNR